METQDAAMEDFKNEVREDIKSMANSVDKLSDSVNKMVTYNAVNAEKESNQQDFNNRVGNRIEKLEIKMEKITIERAIEKPSRDFIMKWWPWLLVAMTVSTGVIAAISSGFGKSFFS